VKIVTPGMLVGLFVAFFITGLAAMSQGKSGTEELQNNRYMVSAGEGFAVLVDTKTGCVWTGIGLQMTGPAGKATSVNEFKLASVEGLYSPAIGSGEDFTRRSRAFPERCTW